MKRLSILLTLIQGCVLFMLAAPAGDWKIHPTFADEQRKVIDTPKKVYVLTLSQPIIPTATWMAKPFSQLFVYDKEADEIMGWTSRNYLSGDRIDFLEYNPDKNYLLVIYDDYNIDFIYENGDVVNLPALKNASIAASKSINGISFSPANDQVFLSADFGYAIIDDKRHEVTTSLLTDEPVRACGRTGDRLIVFNSTGAFFTDKIRQGLRWTDFKPITELGPGVGFFPLTDSTFAYITPDTQSVDGELRIVTLDADNHASFTSRRNNSLSAITPLKGGDFYIDSRNTGVRLNKNGTFEAYDLPEPAYGSMHSSIDMRTFWTAGPERGLRSLRRDGQNWSVTRDYMIPNAPYPLFSQNIASTPNHGMIVASNGTTRVFQRSTYLPSKISSYKNGEWKNVSPKNTNPERAGGIFRDAVGLEFDPTDPSKFARATRWDGVLIADLDDPSYIRQLSTSADPQAGKSGFFDVFPVLPTYPSNTGMTAPSYDSYGTLWSARHLFTDGQTTNNAYLYYWTAADRKADKVSGIGHLEVKGITAEFTLFLKALRSQANRNVILYYGGGNGGSFAIYDHGGTLADTSDDKCVIVSNPKDQDGSTVTYEYIHEFYEDPQTGIVWVATGTGLFTLNPQTILKTGQSVVNRIKIARNDGTNLADYLLDGIPIYDICSDASGRKWFATGGGGLVCTSADGRTIHNQLTMSNSYIPADVVYAAEYNPAAGSLLISTDKGIAEYFPSGSSSAGENLDEVKAYPNPVRPDYLGWITIEGLTEGATVKIIDSGGGLVRELGPAENGTVQWDGTNIAFKRVGSGVYYVLAASGSDGKFAKVTKILVVR